MALGEIDDVDVVPQAGAVRGVVVSAEDHELFTPAHSHLGDERDQVIRDALRVLADPAEGCAPTGLK